MTCQGPSQWCNWNNHTCTTSSYSYNRKQSCNASVSGCPCKKATGILAGSRQESRSPPRSRRDHASPGIFPPGSRQEKNPAIDPAGTPTGNLRLHRDPAKNPDYPEIPAGSCQPGYFPTGISLGKKSRHKSRRDSHRESLSSPGSRHESRLPRDPAGILPTRYFPAGIPSGKNSRSDSCRESLSSRGSRQGNKIFPARCFVLAGLDEIT